MVNLTFVKYDPLQGSPGEELWREGTASFIDDGYSEIKQVGAPLPDIVGYVALVDGVPASLTAYRYMPDGKRVIAPLAYTRPAYRRLGIYHSLREFYRADALSRGYTHVVCINIQKPGAESINHAVEASKGERQPRAEDWGFKSVIETPHGPIEQWVYVIWWNRENEV
jgi:hypothetical protein